MLSSCGAFLLLLWQRYEDSDVVYGKEARLAAKHTLIPVLIYLAGQNDDVTFFKAQLSLVFWLEGVKRPTAGLI